VQSSKIVFVAKVVSFSVAMFSVGLAVSGCEALDEFNKKKKEVTGKAKYGAIAFDEDKGGWGYSYNQPTEATASEKATEKCSSCKVHLTWEGGCAALAQSETDKKVMSAKTGGTQAAAEGAAKASCLAKKAGACKVVVWACNSKDSK
jgi:radical SAM protein with 4Fe4S-binding SPASM domain